MIQDLNDMVLFAEVAERRSFAAAGRALGIPVPRLSRRVADLEQALGVQLLQRSTRHLSLTPAGELYLHHCQGMREAADVAAQAVAQMRHAPRGIVRLSCPVSLAHTVVGPALHAFMAQYPDVRVLMRVLNRPINLVEEGIDIMLNALVEIEDSATLVAKQFSTARMLLVASAAQLARQGPVHVLEDLGRIDTAANFTKEGVCRWNLQDPEGRIHVVQVVPRYVVRDFALLKHAVRQGVGATMLPDYMCQDELRLGEFAEVLPGWVAEPLFVHALFPARRALVPAVRALLDFLAEHLRTLDYHEAYSGWNGLSEESA